MAKMTRNMLKGIVKECLVELLAEGLSSSASGLSESRSIPRSSAPQPKKRASIFDQLDKSFATNRPKTGFNEAVTNAARAATSNPMMQEILADTAKTTLQEQLRHEPRSSRSNSQLSYDMHEGADGSSLSMGADAGLDIDSLFGESTSNWSKLLELSDTKKLP